MEAKERSEYLAVIRILRSGARQGLTLAESFAILRGEQPWFTSIDQLSKRLARRGLPKASQIYLGARVGKEWEKELDGEEPPPAVTRDDLDDNMEAFRLESNQPLVDSPLLSVGQGELERTLIIPDTHIPYEDPLAFALTMKVGRILKPNRIVFLGDFADFFSVSDHDKDPRRITTLSFEVGKVKERLDEVADLGAERVIFCAGNHEYRLERYLQRNAPPLIDYFSIPDLFGLNERGWTYVPYRRHIKVGKWYATHEVGFAGVHAAHSTLQAFGHSIVFGHSHQLNSRYLGNIIGERFVAVNAGWLGDPYKADYAHESKRRFWQTGFAVAYTNPRTECFQIDPVPIVNYECMVGGKLVTLR